MSLLNEFMCGPLDIQDIKGKNDAEAEHDTGSLPDWLINPGEYEPVVLTTEHRAVLAHRHNQRSKKADSCVYLRFFTTSQMQLKFLCLHLSLVVVVTLLFIYLFVCNSCTMGF